MRCQFIVACGCGGVVSKKGASGTAKMMVKAQSRASLLHPRGPPHTISIHTFASHYSVLTVRQSSFHNIMAKQKAGNGDNQTGQSKITQHSKPITELSAPDHLSILPDEILLRIFGFIPPPDPWDGSIKTLVTPTPATRDYFFTFLDLPLAQQCCHEHALSEIHS